jgi:hypothetical protein
MVEATAMPREDKQSRGQIGGIGSGSVAIPGRFASEIDQVNREMEQSEKTGEQGAVRCHP